MLTTYFEGEAYHCTYGLIKQSARYDDDVAHELHSIEHMPFQMKDRTIADKDPCR